MKFIKDIDNIFKFKSIKFPIYGSFIFGLLPIIIEKSMNTELIPPEHHALVVSVILPALAFYGRILYQPELDKPKRGITKVNKPRTRKAKPNQHKQG